MKYFWLITLLVLPTIIATFSNGKLRTIQLNSSENVAVLSFLRGTSDLNQMDFNIPE